MHGPSTSSGEEFPTNNGASSFQPEIRPNLMMSHRDTNSIIEGIEDEITWSKNNKGGILAMHKGYS